MQEFFCPARYLKSPAFRYRVELGAYIIQTIIHFYTLFSDTEHCYDSDGSLNPAYHFNNIDVVLLIITFGHALNEVKCGVGVHVSSDSCFIWSRLFPTRRSKI